MFGMNFLQALLIILFAAYRALDLFGPQTFILGWSHVGTGFIVGVILGNPKLGLEIGANLSLMSLGVVGLGGASVPNFTLTTIVATIVAIQTGQDYSVGLTIGLPVGMMSVYLDILIKTVGVGIANRAQALVDKGEFKKGVSHILIMPVLNILQYALPVAIVIFAGQGVTQAIVDAMPDWLANGLQVAGKLLPVTGMAMLLNYMPVKKHWHYLVLGFVLYSYLGLGILPIGLIGLVFAIAYYKNQVEFAELRHSGVSVGGDMEDE